MYRPLVLLVALAAGCERNETTAPRPHASRPMMHEVDPGPGASGPGLFSQNVKLLANVARSEEVTQSDLAFDGHLAYAGNYHGFRVLDIEDPERPTVVADVACHGAQSDVSVYANLLIQSVDVPQSSGLCTSHDFDAGDAAADMFEGVRVFDVSNPAAPVRIASVFTDCGSHTHTLVPDPVNNRVLIYISSYPRGLSLAFPSCTAAHGYISIVEVSLANPSAAHVLTKYQLDPNTELTLLPGAAVAFRACHDITVFLELGLAAAACMSEVQLWNIKDPANPTLTWRADHSAVSNPNGDIWHSAAFSWDGKVVAFGDESGGGAEARCMNPVDQHGRVWFFDVATGGILGSYKIPRVELGVCTIHNFNFVPLPNGRKLLVSAAYTGGTTIVDVDKLLAGVSAGAAEIGFSRRSGALTWSSYWYNGFIYANDMLRGLDVMLLSDKARAGDRKLRAMNPQTQDRLIQ
jgi:hypothetical protein